MNGILKIYSQNMNLLMKGGQNLIAFTETIG